MRSMLAYLVTGAGLATGGAIALFNTDGTLATALAILVTIVAVILIVASIGLMLDPNAAALAEQRIEARRAGIDPLAEPVRAAASVRSTPRT